KSELAEEIFRETLNKKDHWNQWRGNIEKITEECQESVRMLRAYFPPTEVDPFQASLMEIATNIAMAYHEGGPPPSTLTIFLSRLRERFGRKQYESLPALHAHISRAERQAILALAEALHMPASSSPKST
ncbi:MAG: hypothetical protein KDJ15_06775, partial [Alphaproteobacteria bacterium]|nr:hypothetical protein [Alphaproteobacteria bacterium]